MPSFAHAYRLSRRHLTGPTIGGPVEVVRDPAADPLRPGDPLLVHGVAVEGPYFYRGPVNREGAQIGFALANGAGQAVLLSDAAVEPGLEVTIGDKAERLVGVLPATLIQTPGGARAVETLAEGDLVCVQGGAAEPVRRVGRRWTSALFSDPLHACPVRIRAGALGAGLPLRDLAVSADCALLLGGVLIQAGALVGYGAACRDEAETLATHLQVELAAHSLIIAEGVPVESYCLVGRIASGPQELDEAAPEDTFGAAEMDLPRAKSHRQVPYRVREMLQG
jgi:hypothetical protein